MGEEVTRYSSAIEEKKSEFAAATNELERVTAAFASEEERSHELQSQINDLLYQKQLLALEFVLLL